MFTVLVTPQPYRKLESYNTCIVLGGTLQIVQTASGQHIVTSVPAAGGTPAMNGPTPASAPTATPTLQLPTSSAVMPGKPVMRVAPSTPGKQTC